MVSRNTTTVGGPPTIQKGPLQISCNRFEEAKPPAITNHHGKVKYHLGLALRTSDAVHQLIQIVRANSIKSEIGKRVLDPDHEDGLQLAIAILTEELRDRLNDFADELEGGEA